MKPTENVYTKMLGALPIQNSMKQDALLPLLLNFALENARRKVQENQDWK
jgi:hypothetical protein